MNEVDPDTAAGEVVDEAAKVRQVPGQAVHAMDKDRIALTGERQEAVELRTLGVLPGSVIGKDVVEGDLLQLPLRVLVDGADAAIADALARHGCLR